MVYDITILWRILQIFFIFDKCYRSATPVNYERDINIAYECVLIILREKQNKNTKQNKTNNHTNK